MIGHKAYADGRDAAKDAGDGADVEHVLIDFVKDVDILVACWERIMSSKTKLETLRTAGQLGLGAGAGAGVGFSGSGEVGWLVERKKFRGREIHPSGGE